MKKEKREVSYTVHLSQSTSCAKFQGVFSRDLISQWSVLSSVWIKTNTHHGVMQTGLLVIYLLRNEPALLHRLTGLQGCSQDPPVDSKCN